MIWDLVAMVTAGVGGAGILLLVARVLRVKLPRWAVPATAGVAMFVFAVWNEYAWYPRVRDALPESVRIVSAPADAAFYQPWTYAFPIVRRFLAVDLGSAIHSETEPQQFVAPVMFIERWTPVRQLPFAFDCANGRRTDVFPGGRIEDAEWVTPGPEDDLLATACAGG
ncbi:hypothetical protein OEW28_04755 [Defluviimonas sp. WL0002]|uniref:Uncharacterized protein n=1 Tax=Albidovulum marisflavi TaxID=2984159 RepID=A0ABT2Z9X1_9RHOB|nr:hypothetical protein [Defluviimonas sp. WL0002]MCV2867929.1 hypothetical protein [Defluviimonas sp. WL0002]